MPVVIKELIIRAQVDSAQSKAPRPQQSSALPAKTSKDMLLEECVEAVLEILRQKEER